jgi:SAM-dependent methyltransferase
MTAGTHQPEPWQLYERHASRWVDLRGGPALLEAPWLARFASLLGPGASVLDLGCGHGAPVGAWLLAQGFALTGLDRAAPLIDRARSDLPSARWLVGDLRTFELGRRFDGLVLWHSLFHLTGDEQLGVFPRLARHASPGAALLFTTGAAAGVATGSFGDEPLHHYSLSLESYEEALAEIGCSVHQRRVEDPDCGGATVWLATFESTGRA